MRLGGPVLQEYGDPEEWVAALKARRYRAANCPVGKDADEATVNAYVEAAAQADIVIAEVGAWSNPVSPDDEVRRAAIGKCQEQLALADRVGALCCVNITGSRGKVWDGPHPDNLTPETFDLIVETTREIIDAVKPKRTFYTLETMPWMYPDSADSYVALLKAIDRPHCAAHLDPVNLVCSPQRYFANGALIKECFEKLGPYIKGCHAKDIILRDTLTTHLDEVCPGDGGLDYVVLLQEMDRLDPDVPLMLEHMQREEQYAAGALHIRTIAEQIGVAL